jgi:hypothetical protein
VEGGATLTVDGLDGIDVVVDEGVYGAFRRAVGAGVVQRLGEEGRSFFVP